MTVCLLMKFPSIKSLFLSSVNDGEETSTTNHPQPATLLTITPEPAVEAARQVSPPAAESNAAHEKVPLADPEATAETPAHPQDLNLGIPPKKLHQPL